MAAAIKSTQKAESLEKKFFDLVVQPNQSNEDSKVKSLPEKNALKLEKKRRLVHRAKSVEPSKKPILQDLSSTVKTVPSVPSIFPLRVLLTANPSATVLQCTVQREVKDAAHSPLLSKQTPKNERKTENTQSTDQKDGEEKTVAYPQIIELGLRGVFELIRETVSQHKSLCCKALRALLNMLQGQKLEGMKNEPHLILENLFQTLLELSRLPSDDTDASSSDDYTEVISDTSLPGIGPFEENILVANSVPSLASSCLLSLVFAWGNTSKLLVVVTSFVADCSSQKQTLFVKIPSSFVELQRMVTAALLGKNHIPMLYQAGVVKSSLFRTWIVQVEDKNSDVVSLKCDGTFLYCLLRDGQLLKIGTGYDATVEGLVYRRRSIFDLGGCSKLSSSESNQLFYCEDTLYLLTRISLFVIDRKTLGGRFLCKLPSLEGAWFSDDDGLGCLVVLPQEDSYSICVYKIDCDKAVVKRPSLKVQPMRKHLHFLGNSPGFSPIHHTQSNKADIVQVCVGQDFSLSRSSSGAIFFAGKSDALGLTKGKGRRVLQPEPLPLPSGVKISHMAVAPEGGHGVMISDSGEVYFVGTSKRGEDGEASKNRRQPAAQKPKLMKCMEGKSVVNGCCNAGTSAFVTKDGKLFLFGKDSTQADSKTGLVSSLSDVRVKQVALGKAHIVVLSADGRIWTAGVNSKGQCGRQEGVVSIAQRIAEVEQERDVSMPEDKSLDDVRLNEDGSSGTAIAPICSPDKHKWRKGVCMVCAVCGECTGYGSSCINSSLDGRYPGTPCGCGAGDSGCTECGCCKTCAGEVDLNREDKKKAPDNRGNRIPAEPALLSPNLAQQSTPILKRLAALYQRGKRKGGANAAGKDNSRGSSLSKSDVLQEANKMALLPLVQISLDACRDKPVQIACGSHHTIILTETGSVYGFGQNTHGQLGLGDTTNRNAVTWIPTPAKIAQVAAGSHHSVLLSSKGIVYGCGSNSANQLGDLRLNESLILTPVPILGYQQPASDRCPRVSWISACHTFTFIEYEEVLLTADQLRRARIFSDNSALAISYKLQDPESRDPAKREGISCQLLVDKLSGSCKLVEGEDCVSLSEDEQACVDTSHNVLWSLNASTWTASSYLLSGFCKESSDCDTLYPFSPELAVSMKPGSLTTRTQAGLNLLSCIDTLVKRCPSGVHVTKDDERSSEQASPGRRKAKEQHTADEYSIVNRFKSHGGGWGYSVHSTEAIRFMVDCDILLGGVGVFGGRGEYSVIVSLFEEQGESDGQGEGELLVETDRIPYESGFREKFHAIFDDPVPIQAGQWYTVTAKVNGPSSDCGSHGEQSVVTSDNVKFSFRRSKRSNNGTDVSAGQIPELLYTLPLVTSITEKDTSHPPTHVLPVQIASKDFYMNFSENALETLPYVLECSRTALFLDVGKKSARYMASGSVVVPPAEELATNVIRDLAYVFASCLRLLRVAIAQNFPLAGRDADGGSAVHSELVSLIETMLTDGELDAALDDALQMPASERALVTNSAMQMVTECHLIITECMDMLHPSPPKKWNYLHQALEIYHNSAPEQKPRASRLLLSVLDALCQPSINLVQCLPLFPRTFSNLASIASAAQSPNTEQGLYGTEDSPSTTGAVGFYEVANLLVEIACSSARSLVNLEKKSGGRRRGPAVLDDMNSSFLLRPSAALVTSACNFLVTLSCHLAYKACDSSQSASCGTEDKQQYNVVSRFDGHSNDRSWSSGSGSPDAVSFSVDTDKVHVIGFGVFGGGKEERKYELELLKHVPAGAPGEMVRWEAVDMAKGTITPRDCNTDHVAHIKLNRPVLLQKNQLYAVRLHHSGESTYFGEKGRSKVKGSDGTTFIFSHWHGSHSTNGSTVSRGQIPAILYKRILNDDASPLSPGDEWVGTATTPLKAGMTYQRHALNIIALVSEAAVEILNAVPCLDEDDLAIRVKDEGTGYENEKEPVFGEQEFGAHGDLSKVKLELKEKISQCARNVLSSELISVLLPRLFSDVGVLARKNPYCAVEVMDIVRDLLPPLINAQQLAYPQQAGKEGTAKSYTVVVESSHPYKPASVCQYKATFPKSVRWMVLEFSPKCQTSQAEDFLRILLANPNSDVATSNEEAAVNKVQTISAGYPVLQKMYQDKNWPQKSVLLPGREILFSLETASDYTNNKDMKPSLFYGFRCVVTGYESPPFSNKSDELVNELVNVAGLCAVNLMTVHGQLWESVMQSEEGRSSPTTPTGPEDKIEHLKAIESTASITLEQHSSLFLQGLHLNSFPSAAEALSGDLPISDGSKEKKFLLDFVAAAVDTSGGRLARWLQPDSYVDPKRCMLQLNVKSLFQTLPTSVTIITRDQYSTPVFVPTLKVELSAKPQPPSHCNFRDFGSAYDISPSEPSPTFEAQYEPTKHRDSKYHSISMMRAYKKYSFEELRYAYPLKRTLKTENVLVASVGNGIYRATWIPSHATTYVLQVTLDQQLKGPRQIVDVADAPKGSTEGTHRPVPPGLDLTGKASRYLQFATKNSKGLRIRSNPTLQSPQVGLLQYGDVIECVDETFNSDGNWAKLSEASIEKFCQSIQFPEAWCISYHKHNDRTLLVPVDSSSQSVAAVDHTHEPDGGEHEVQFDSTKQSSDFPKTPCIFAGPSSSSQPSAFSTPFAVAASVSDSIDWKKLKIPGVYKVAKCGAAGHNIRYKPSLKAAPVGKLTPGSSFTATSVVKNKRGVWLALHKPDLAKFCDEIPDGGSAWTLAVAADGTEHLLSTEKPAQHLVVPVASAAGSRSHPNINSLVSKEGSSALAIRGALLAKLTNPFNNAPSNNADSEAVDLLVASDASADSAPVAQPLAVAQPTTVRALATRKSLMQGRALGHQRSLSDPSVKTHRKSRSDSSGLAEEKMSAPEKISGCKSDAKYRPQELFTRGRGRGPHSPGTSPLTRSHSSPSSKCSTKVQRSESALAKDGHSQASSRRMSAGSSRSSRKPKHKSPSATGGRPRAESLSGSSASTNGRSVPPNKCPSQKSENRSITADQTPPPDKIIRGGQDLRKKLAKQVDRAVNSTEEVPARVALNGLEAADDLPFIDDVVDTEGNIVSPSKLGVGSASSDSSLLEASTEPHTSTDKQRTCKAGSKAESSAGGSLLTPKTSNRQHFAERLRKKFVDGQSRLKLNKPVTDALSPLVAESSRAVFAAFLWHEGIVHDAMACASFLKFSQTQRSQIMKYMRQGKAQCEDQVIPFAIPAAQTPPCAYTESLRESTEFADSHPPDTLVYLAMFWDKLSETVTKIAIRNQNLPPPAPVNHNLNSGQSTPVPKPTKRTKRELVANDYNDPELMVRVPPLKRRAHHRFALPQLAQARKNIQGQPMFYPYMMVPQRQRAEPIDGGDHFKDTMCDLCDKVFPYPVTYHMKQAHPGCGKFAGGLGYNSSGYYCGGWAGDCGDGGVGGSTWYLLCVPCREKYKLEKSASTASKNEEARTSGSGEWKKVMHRVLMQPVNAHQVMKNNSMFLLDLVSSASSSGVSQLSRNKQLGVIDSHSEEATNSESQDMWSSSDLLPQSGYSHCPFPSTMCSYLHGKTSPKPAAAMDKNSRSDRGIPDFRNRSLSTQHPAPSSSHFKSVFQRLSVTPDASVQKSEAELFQRRNRIMRSISAGSQPHDKKSVSNNNEDMSLAASTGSYLLHHPSPSMLKLMSTRENSNFVADAIARSSVLAFVTQRHDLRSLHVTMQMTLRRAALRVYVLQALTWLLRTVVSETNIHDILWYFVSALAGSNNSENKNEGKPVDAGAESTDEDAEETKALCQHPVKCMALAGIDSMKPLVEAFHGFLQTVSDIMMFLPSNSPVQLMAIRCWRLKVLPSDHRFLHESQVFSHISQILSKVDLTSNADAPKQKKLVKIKANSRGYVPVVDEDAPNQAKVKVLTDLTSKVRVTTSSHAAIANSLTDGSTETFWESGDEDKNKPKAITVDCLHDKDGNKKPKIDIRAEEFYVHIDNTRDVQKKVNSISFWTTSENDDWKKEKTADLNAQFVGWVPFSIPGHNTLFKVELRGSDNGLRVRQIKVLGHDLPDGPKYQQQLPAKVLQVQICEAELLKVFKLLTAEVFGQLLSEDAAVDCGGTTQIVQEPESVGGKEDDAGASASSPSPRDVDPNLREHMVGILFSRKKLSSLQKKVFEHTVHAIHTETSRIKKAWEAALDATSSPAHHPRSVPIDSYCFELLSMILALTGSDVGRHYVAQQSTLIEDFVVLLHTGSPRMQRQVTLLLRRILREVTPGRLASVMNARVPTQYKLADSDTEQEPSDVSVSDNVDEESSPLISVMDPLFACISKALKVQVKRATVTEPKPTTLTAEGDAASTIKASKRAQSVTLNSFFPGRPADKIPMWWMHGTMEDKSIVEAVMKLLTDMSMKQISPAWCNVAKCAVSEAVLSLTKLTDCEREPDSCLSNSIMWRALAALCVLDRDHVDKLSSAESCQKKNQLHRYLALQDKERTHIFTFLVENPQDISSFDVRSREFQFAGHRWYVYSGKPNNEYFSFYLRIVNLGKDVRVHTVYSFNVVNLVNYQNNYAYHSPAGGRVFSRDEDALSWGWKEFIRRETLLKPNGGFIFDGNKALLELECKSYKVVFEESVKLPEVTEENPFPTIHTSPFSVGGFAWQIRIFPDGPDEENKGNVALFLHCTTADHLARVKARFLIEGQQSPVVYEHTFPPNTISEMPSGVAFPSQSEFMNSLKDNKIRVGVEFLSVFEVNEIHVTLSEPNTYPTVCVTPFDDLEGCPWVLKTLQASNLKLKMDQNDKTTSGLMEFYHRHIMWNATLISPGTEDISINIPLNTKGPMIGYFGENWSDADVIKTDLSVDDLAQSDNPYRTDVDDGYDRYSYVTIHVEIVSNHLLYKTPAPSPTGDRERKLLYNARKDRAHLHTKYQELLRQKAVFESKCQNLTRERTRLMGGADQSCGEPLASLVEPDFSTFLFDVLIDLSLLGASKGKVLEGRQGRLNRVPAHPTESERSLQFALYRNDFSLLVADAQPDHVQLASVECEVEAFRSKLVAFIQAKSALRITDIAMTGSLGMKTICSNRWDVDFVLFSADLPKNGHCMWMPSFVVALARMLEDGSKEGKLPNTGNFAHTTYSVQFDLRGNIEVDLYVSYDWKGEESYEALYDELLKQRTSENLTWFCPCAALRQKEFIDEQPAQVKDLIKVVKYWRNAAVWNDQRCRPSSYLLSLLLVRAYENACHIIEGSLPSNRTVLKCFVKLVLSTANSRPKPLRVSWGRFYDPSDYNIEYSSASSAECPPIVQDPANPANNVAERPASWVQFRQMLEAWAHSLGMMEEGTMLPIDTARK